MFEEWDCVSKMSPNKLQMVQTTPIRVKFGSMPMKIGVYDVNGWDRSDSNPSNKSLKWYWCKDMTISHMSVLFFTSVPTIYSW